ncbi:type IV toxin-antitoxin system AbiEi family antitoxin domain-containing protein [Nocardioides sp.]|uniref:type IV toxin-antitoxin system AbiEi family antitoxin domain-containing protein n=1 Tax=Nocardioides sp. TaxID=35761 RepID=UPI002ED41E81
MEVLADLLELQVGVVTRSQAMERGLTSYDIRRLVRRRELTVVHRGVYVNHTGQLTWLQRAWAATLALAPAALSHSSAIRAADGPGRRADERLIHVAVERNRNVAAPAGVSLHRMLGFADRVQWNCSPPRVRIEEALVDVAARSKSDFAAIEVLADALQSRRTTTDRLLTAIAGRTRVARRSFLEGVLDDLAQGTCSVLEHGYLTRVERPHGLAVPRRQVRASARGPVYRDVEYRAQRLVVELDGRLFHDNAGARDHDLDRDLDAAVDGLFSVRLGWGQVFARPCATAHRIGRLLHARGWSGPVKTCPECAYAVD